MEVIKDKVWLVKIPEIIYNQLINEKDLGVLEVYQNEDDIYKPELKVNFTNKIDPSQFDINYSKTTSFFTFKEKKHKIREAAYLGRLVANDERVSDKVTLKVAKDELMNKATVGIEKGKGRPQTQGTIRISQHQYFATNDNMQKAMNQKNRKDKNLKKTRMDKDELKSEIFNLFNDKQYWTNKELVAKLDQPENYLKEVISEICNYIKSGPKKGCYELKQIYMNAHEEDEEMEG
jgi:hypothetical protein